MKLKHLAAFFVLLAVGCTQQPGSVSAPVTEPGGTATGDDTAATIEPETETQLVSNTVRFDVTGMS